jgi:hypothetical protein
MGHRDIIGDIGTCRDKQPKGPSSVAMVWSLPPCKPCPLFSGWVSVSGLGCRVYVFLLRRAT